MAKSAIRVLVVDDFQLFRRFVASILREQPELQIIGEASDGWEAVQKAEELQPDLILLDLGMPKLNGIEAAQQIRKVSPNSRILFLSQESSASVVQKALRVGGCGYVVKTDAGSELLTAVNTVVRGEKFVGRRFAGHDFTAASDAEVPEAVPRNEALAPLVATWPQRAEKTRCHEAHFYSDDASFLDGFTRFIGAALKAGNAVIVVATESHRDSLLPRLQAHGLDIGAAIEQGRFIALDAAHILSTLTVNDQLDPARFLELAGTLITAAAKFAQGERPRVAICGECEPPLWTLGTGEAAIQLEQLWNVITEKYDVDILCGYPLGPFLGEQGSPLFPRICAEHSAVHSL